MCRIKQCLLGLCKILLTTAASQQQVYQGEIQLEVTSPCVALYLEPPFSKAIIPSHTSIPLPFIFTSDPLGPVPA